jgi:hypothetical protein
MTFAEAHGAVVDLGETTEGAGQERIRS